MTLRQCSRPCTCLNVFVDAQCRRQWEKHQVHALDQPNWSARKEGYHSRRSYYDGKSCDRRRLFVLLFTRVMTSSSRTRSHSLQKENVLAKRSTSTHITNRFNWLCGNLEHMHHWTSPINSSFASNARRTTIYKCQIYVHPPQAGDLDLCRS